MRSSPGFAKARARRQTADRRLRSTPARRTSRPRPRRRVANLREASDQAQGGGCRTSVATTGPFKGISGDLQQTLASARDAMADLAENTEALKRTSSSADFSTSAGYFDLAGRQRPAISRRGARDERPARAPHLDWSCRPVRANGCRRGASERRGQDEARFGDVSSSSNTPKTARLVVEGYASTRLRATNDSCSAVRGRGSCATIW